MNKVLEKFQGKELKNLWVITGGGGEVIDNEKSKNDDRGNSSD